MGLRTFIEWCDSTVNPTTGCDGCELWHRITRGPCYSGPLHEGRLAMAMPHLYAPTFTEVRLAPGRMAKIAAASDLTGTVRPDKPWLDGKPRVIFVGDMGDVMSHGVPFNYLKEEIVDVVDSEKGRRHIWMLLTKQPWRLAAFGLWLTEEKQVPWPANLWAGTSITTRKSASARLHNLIKVPAAVHYVSAEPLLEEVDLPRAMAKAHGFKGEPCEDGFYSDGLLNPVHGDDLLAFLDLVIVGGESRQSGLEPRRFKIEWAQKIVDDCRSADVSCFVKQLGSAAGLADSHGGDPTEWPESLRVRQFPTRDLNLRRNAVAQSGFTLIEVLVVVAILALLIALLLPAIAGAVKSANNAAVQAEINVLAQSLATFRADFGDYPPSRIALNESGRLDTSSAVAVGSGGTNDVTLGRLYTRTQSAFRKFWPRVQTTPSAPGIWPATSTSWYDFNGDGSNGGDAPLILQGHQCLVFFLGGIPITDLSGASPKTIGMAGFSTSLTNPFLSSQSQSTNYSGNRKPVYFDFSPDRLIPDSQTFMPGYTDRLNKDPLTLPHPGFLAYFSTNQGSGYDPNDLNLTEPDSTLSTPAIALSFALPTLAVTRSPAPNPYTSTAPAGGIATVYQRAQSFQILSPGVDSFYGVGGAYTDGQPFPAENSLSNSSDPQLRVYEADNLTNFHNGKLQ